ncbi:AraC family transcriptional regulator [Prauserella endophytica]|uniref:AraC family transcriptional regulator n=1 Tax=Prauserella endophytica TaxID=1592324 RepID=A0ABY2RVS1_9PSEU|nr:AraC family transcriptional regulator [Prauserella endophytica]PXY33137.1 AraC family transcriptional regulator [Prauserella coralliicola]TKG62574.1 AraC family transcriptional regulator [Prauserella endophytica]
MDALGRLLDGPRAHGAFVLRALLDPPWSIHVRDRSPLTLVAVATGEAWLVPGDGEAVRLRENDIALVRGPEPYTVADDPATEPTVIVHPGQRCTTPDGEELCEVLRLGVRTWGTGGDTTLLVGAYELPGAISRRLLAALPERLVLPHAEWESPLVPLLAAEIGREEPGQTVVLDRLLDLLVITALRTHLARADAAGSAWYHAHSDPVVGHALRLLHDNPALPWTVATLAAKTGVSRAVLARRFTELVGESPMAYLTGWRLALAADLLREPDTTVDAVARKVGYGSAFALSTAFKRVRGVSPQQHRDSTVSSVG